jgi:hypothetical protein
MQTLPLLSVSKSQSYQSFFFFASGFFLLSLSVYTIKNNEYRIKWPSYIARTKNIIFTKKKSKGSTPGQTTVCFTDLGKLNLLTVVQF